jgi:PAS domain S-box-containing protein
MDKRTGSDLTAPVAAEYLCDAAEGRLTGSCDALGAWLGYAESELQSHPVSRLLLPESRGEEHALRASLTASAHTADRLLAFRHKDGRVLWALVLAEGAENPADTAEIRCRLIPAPGAGRE